jgi:hypothetical protein
MARESSSPSPSSSRALTPNMAGNIQWQDRLNEDKRKREQAKEMRRGEKEVEMGVWKCCDEAGKGGKKKCGCVMLKTLWVRYVEDAETLRWCGSRGEREGWRVSGVELTMLRR